MSDLGYAAAARAITDHFGLVPPLDRRQVYEWNQRRTENALGHAFPSPAGSGPDGSPRFDVIQVIGWYAGGPPGPRGAGWETPAERNARMASPAEARRRKQESNARNIAGR